MHLTYKTETIPKGMTFETEGVVSSVTLDTNSADVRAWVKHLTAMIEAEDNEKKHRND